MIVFDLICGPHGHRFEAWFASSDAFAQQKAQGLLACPICGSDAVEKAVMAPRVGAKGNQREERHASVPALPASQEGQGQEGPVAASPDPATVEKMRALVGALARAQAELLKSSQWVGRNFAEEARAMHYGEADKRPIHGEVAPKEAEALVEEGIDVAPLPLPIIPPSAQN